MVLTVHRWFANKSCPGSWMYARMGDLASKVTAQLSSSKQEEALAVNDTEKTIWDFLHGKISNAYGAAGMMGNLYAESALRPDNLQNTYEKKLGMTDAEYMAAVDNGSYTNFVKDSAGYGLTQWTYWSRKQALLEFAQAAGEILRCGMHVLPALLQGKGPVPYQQSATRRPDLLWDLTGQLHSHRHCGIRG